MKSLNFILALLLLLFISAANAQEIIHFQNPSFEDMPRKGGSFSSPITSWQDCGLQYFPGESPPDIHPVPILGGGGAWNVSTQAHHLQTFLGLTTRFNNTWESVSQMLPGQLSKDSCYSFSVWLCQSPTYISNTTRSKNIPESFVQPIALYIWGGETPCRMTSVLGMAGPVDHMEWKEYVIEFKPTENVKSIMLQAFYYAPNNESLSFVPEAYNGHLLVDNLSPISRIACE
jgi:hypothetical protein